MRVIPTLALGACLTSGRRVKHSDDLASIMSEITQESAEITQESGDRFIALTAGCPSGKVQESPLGDCQDASTQSTVPYYCCNVIYSCSMDSTSLLTYTRQWWKHFQDECGVLSSDFQPTSDGTGLKLVGLDNVCSPKCLSSQVIQGRESPKFWSEDLIERCSDRVDDSNWKPQLDEASWPEDQVRELGDALYNCEGGDNRPTTTTPTITTTTQTLWVPDPPTAPPPGSVPESYKTSFDFMTGDFTRYRKRPGLWGHLMKFIFRKRIRNNDKPEEVVRGHICGRDKSSKGTYLASSLCYWLPEIQDGNAIPANVGLEWSGGERGNAGSMCGGVGAGFSEKGVCMKCVSCHNNALHRKGKLETNSWAEKIILSDTCLKEKEVEKRCLTAMQSEKGELIAQVERCSKSKARFQRAEAALNMIKALLSVLPDQINTQLPNYIKHYDQLIESNRVEVVKARKAIRAARFEASDTCEAYVEGNFPWWYFKLKEDAATEDILAGMSFRCNYPEKPLANSDSNYADKIRHWREVLMPKYQSCKKCDASRSKIEREYEQGADFIALENKAMKLRDELRKKLAKKQQEYDALMERLEGAEREEQNADSEWGPSRDQCNAALDEYSLLLPTHMKKCVPSFYDQSCEKECIEIQKSWPQGCGVVEGSRPSDKAGRGGVVSTCRPPASSWMQSPFTYVVKEPTSQQCRRIFNDGEQKDEHSQKVIKTGVLHFKQGWFWRKRWYVLEGGDMVRSGILYYYKDDPAKYRDENPVVGDKIILWDAGSARKQSAARYRKFGWSCLKISHFYANFVLCAEGKTSKAVRDDWLAGVKKEIEM